MFIKSSILWVKKGFFLTQGSILWVIFKKRVQIFELYSKKGFNSLSYIQKKKVQFFELFEEFNTLSHIEKWFLKRGSILWVIKRVSHLWVIEWVQFFESYFWKRCSILWAFFPKVQSFESLLKKKTKGFNSLSHFSRQDHVQKNGFNFYESCWKKKSVQFCELYSKKGFNSVNEIQKNQFLESSLKKKVGFFESYF